MNTDNSPDVDNEARSELYQAILDAALQQFVSAGYHGASMREIARLSGASKALLYYHFQNKADLYFGLLIRSLTDLGTLVDEARRTGAAARDQMRVILSGMLSWSPEKRSLVTQARQEVVHLDPEQREVFMQKFHRTFIGQIEAILQEGIQSGQIRETDPMLAAQIFFGMAMSPMMPEGQRAGESSRRLADMILQVFFDGLAEGSEK
ncbi:MAG: TetR/AcrR family transcriptional regulator [Anaerolineales bacterium]|nr:TetR/AcrR family transcriptional regulator [Anaerolineales bacterium]